MKRDQEPVDKTATKLIVALFVVFVITFGIVAGFVNYQLPHFFCVADNHAHHD